MDPLAELRGLPPLPKLGSNESQEEPTNKNIQTMYKPFIAPGEQQVTGNFDINNGNNNSEDGNNAQKKEEPKDKEKQKKLDKKESTLNDSEYMPILTGLLDSGNIDNKKYEETKTQIKELGEGGKDKIKKIISDIIDGSSLEDNNKEALQKQLNGKEQVKQEDFDKTPFAKHKDLLGLDKGIGGVELLLAENYVEIPNEKGGVNIEQNLATTMDITLNKILKTNTPEFKQNNAKIIGKIRNSSSLEDRYNNLKKLYKEDLIVDAKFGGKKAKKEIIQKQKSLKYKAEEVTLKLATLEKNTNLNEKEKKQQKDVLENKKQKIIDEAKKLDLFEGEVFKAGKEDLNESIEKDPFEIT